ncbi:hypothetical protein DYB35_001956 [Aphanomyces astaci]|uniref:Uncharacterized protein n=1 Tax=Aphanomyces astaci TaxID=112090 RepID=A0A3R7AEC9_APHAT|nr:hypothetical protein DYB35_001956 [Aphanomyces astaci]
MHNTGRSVLPPRPTSPSSSPWTRCTDQIDAKRALQRRQPHSAPPTDTGIDDVEVQSLVQQVSDLQTRLNELTSNATTLTACKRKWSWCDVALSQRKELSDGLHEQKRLKLAVDEHRDIIASLQEVVQSSQRIPMEDWRCNRLPEDQAAWTDGILSMLTRDYERVDTMLVRNGLVDCSTNVCKTVVRRGLCGTVTSIDKVTHLQLQCHTFDDVVKIMNALVLTERGRECLVKGTKWDSLELLERMEHNSMYVKCKAKCHAGTIQWLEGQVAVKRFVELNRVVYVVRSVLEDDRHPMNHPNETCYSHDEVGWFVIERQASAQSSATAVCCVKSIVSCTPSPPRQCVVAKAIHSVALSAADCVQKWYRSCVNVYRQQNRSVTELLVHALAQRFRPLSHTTSLPPPPISSSSSSPGPVPQGATLVVASDGTGKDATTLSAGDTA